MNEEIDAKQVAINRYIGQKISEARVAAGLTRKSLADKIGVKQQQLFKYENGTDKISIARLFLLAEALSLNINYFLEDIKPVEWDKKTSESQIAALNISNNFMKIKDKTCKKAVSALLAVLARIA